MVSRYFRRKLRHELAEAQPGDTISNPALPFNFTLAEIVCGESEEARAIRHCVEEARKVAARNAQKSFRTRQGEVLKAMQAKWDSTYRSRSGPRTFVGIDSEGFNVGKPIRQKDGSYIQVHRTFGGPVLATMIMCGCRARTRTARQMRRLRQERKRPAQRDFRSRRGEVLSRR